MHKHIYDTAFIRSEIRIPIYKGLLFVEDQYLNDYEVGETVNVPILGQAEERGENTSQYHTSSKKIPDVDSLCNVTTDEHSRCVSE